MVDVERVRGGDARLDHSEVNLSRRKPLEDLQGVLAEHLYALLRGAKVSPLLGSPFPQGLTRGLVDLSTQPTILLDNRVERRRALLKSGHEAIVKRIIAQAGAGTGHEVRVWVSLTVAAVQ